MPWQECRKMDERLRFVARLLDGERMAGLYREFDISRQTGYKIYTRYKDCGIHGLTDRSRRPYRHANRLAFQIEALIVQRKRHFAHDQSLADFLQPPPALPFHARPRTTRPVLAPVALPSFRANCPLTITSLTPVLSWWGLS